LVWLSTGSTLGASATVAYHWVDCCEHDARWYGGIVRRMLYMWLRYNKPDASMTGKWLARWLVAITLLPVS